MSIPQEGLVDCILDAADLETDQDLESKWIAAIVLAAHVLARSHPFVREAKLRSIGNDLRRALAEIEKIRVAG